MRECSEVMGVDKGGHSGMNSCSVTNDFKWHILIKETHTALTRDPPKQINPLTL